MNGLLIGEQEIVVLIGFDAEAVAGEEEQHQIAGFDRFQERVEFLVEGFLGAHIGDDLDVLLVEPGILQILAEILGVIHRAGQRIDVPIAVALHPDEERAPCLRLGLRGHEAKSKCDACKNKPER